METAGIRMSESLELSIDWGTFITNIATVAVQGFASAFGLVDGSSNAISSLISAAGSIKIDASPSERGWRLFCLSFAWSFDELRSTKVIEGSDIKIAVQDALGEAKSLIRKEDQTIPVSFLKQPTSLPLYSIIRDHFIKRKNVFRLQTSESDSALRARFDTAFNRSVFEIWSRKPEVFEPLAAALNAPGAAISSFELQWDAYRMSLVHDFEVKPIFGQEQTKVSLSDIYIPLRGIWHEEVEEDSEFDSKANPEHILHVIKADDELGQWIDHGDRDDFLKLIGGSPGSGKSTTVKALARSLALRPEWRPLFIPLQHIDISQDLREAVNGYFVNRIGSPFRQPPLSREAVEFGAPLVLIFDGLDELARPGEAASAVTVLFLVKLNQLITSLRGDISKNIRVLITGRMPSFQAACTYVSATNRKSFEVFGFLPLQRAIEKEYKKAVKGDEDLINSDQRPMWWSQYAPRVGAPEIVPPALTDHRLSGLTHEPLLCYLLALSGYVVDDWEAAAENRNRIYEKLVNEVWKRGWGDGTGQVRRQGPGKTLNKKNFNRLMETVALSAWRGGDTRVASESRFHETLKIMGTEDAWEDFKRDNGPDVANLAMNFYLKSSERDSRGFEFTHKSFGDYLTARSILRIAMEVSDLSKRRLEHAVKDWFNATSTGELTDDLVEFLRDEARLISSDQDGMEKVIELKLGFERIACFAIVDGFPANGNINQTWRVAESYQNASETMIWAVLNACSTAIERKDADLSVINIKWPDINSFGRLISRLTYNRGPISPVRRCFSNINAENANLFGIVLSNTNLSGARLEGADLNGTHLINSDLSKANLQSARLERAHLDGCNIENANLRRAILRDARLGRTSFRDSILEGAEFSEFSFIDDDVMLTEEMLDEALIFSNKERKRVPKSRFSELVRGVRRSNRV